MKAYKTVQSIKGPLLVVEKTKHVAYGELCDVTLGSGETRRGQVLEVTSDKAVVQLFEETNGVDIANTAVAFKGEVATMAVGPDMLGKTFNGMGEPLTMQSSFKVKDKLDINGSAINPSSRTGPSDFIQTGISTIDCMNTLVRGQKLPIFSSAGLPHNELAAQIARQAKVLGKDDDFAVVFAAMGITFEEAHFFKTSLRESGADKNSVLFLNLADDPAVERLITPRAALTTAEYLAYEQGMHVLTILTDFTNYCESLREISAARSEVPGRRGYPGYMYTDLAMNYERAGRILQSNGSVTQLPILTMPGDDITHPIPDLTGYITEGQIVLNRSLNKEGVTPPVNVLKSLSRLMNSGIGEGKTRKDHSAVSNQLYSLYAKAKDLQDLVAVVGKSALTEDDLKILNFANSFENRFVNQGFDENREIEQTLGIAWDLFAEVPESSLKKLKPEDKQKYMKKK